MGCGKLAFRELGAFDTQTRAKRNIVPSSQTGNLLAEKRTSLSQTAANGTSAPTPENRLTCGSCVPAGSQSVRELAPAPDVRSLTYKMRQ
jgi:hypothetical protein